MRFTNENGTLEGIVSIKNTDLYGIKIEKQLAQNAYAKLKRLEDLEEELGIDLITLFKASKNGIVFIDNNTHNIRLAYNIKIDIYEKELVDINIDEGDEPMYFKFKDYGKDWALTKEELL